jgi:hypothetical protein
VASGVSSNWFHPKTGQPALNWKDFEQGEISFLLVNSFKPTKMKLHFVSLAFSFILLSAVVYGQNNLFIATPVEVAYEKKGAIRGCAGIIDDNYYVLENDYGARFDFNNNIQTIVSVFSISNGKLKKRFNLNEIVANSRKEINKILFCDIITWRGKLIGFYTYKNPAGKNFLASAVVLDPMGKVIKDGINIGDFEHNYKDGSFLWQGGLLVNGRNTLSVINDFQYRFSPDSSRMIILTSPPTDGSGNIRFLIYNSNLEINQEVKARIPVQEKIADMTDFAVDNGGTIYLITKTYKSKSDRRKLNDEEAEWELHSIAPADMKVKTSSLNIYGRIMNFSALAVKSDNQVYCVGTYWNADDSKTKGNTKGVYSVHVNNTDKPGTFTRHNYDIPDSITYYLKCGLFEKCKDKDLKVQNGIDESFGLSGAFPDNNGGMFITMAAETEMVTVRGSTGALNSNMEMTKYMLVIYINNEKKIKWTAGIRQLSSNPPLMTRRGRSCFYVHKNILQNAMIATKGLFICSYSEKNGAKVYSIPRPLPPKPKESQYFGFDVVDKTLLPIGNGEYVVTVSFEDLVSIIRFKPE